jgi:hypothetical protein
MLIGRRLCVAAFLGCLYALFGGTARAEPAEIGMDRSNLTRLSEAEQEKTLRNIHDLGAIWFRDGFASATPDAVAKFVNEIKLIKQNQLKFLAIVSPTSTDYDPGYTGTNAGDDFRKIFDLWDAFAGPREHDEAVEAVPARPAKTVRRRGSRTA